MIFAYMKKYLKAALHTFVLASSFLPVLAQAATSGAPITNFSGLVTRLMDMINSTIPFIIALAVLVFLWGIFQLVLSGDSEEKQKEAKNIIFYGIICLFVMVSVWGLVRILTATFFNNTFFLPQLK